MSRRVGGWICSAAVLAACGALGCERLRDDARPELVSSPLGTATSYQVSVQTPRSLPVTAVAVSTTGALTLGPRANVYSVGAPAATVANLGAGGTKLLPGSALDDLWSVSDVE